MCPAWSSYTADRGAFLRDRRRTSKKDEHAPPVIRIDSHTQEKAAHPISSTRKNLSKANQIPTKFCYWSPPWVRSLGTGVSVPKRPPIPWLMPALKKRALAGPEFCGEGWP